jgi:hypothetical protein
MIAQVDHRTGLEVLDRDECLSLFERSSLGRLAVVIDGRPLVFPVNFAPGTKLYGARSGPVAFECGGTDGVYHTGWSVLATGSADEVRDDAEVARMERLPLGVWCPGPKLTWLRIGPRRLTGRRIPPHGHSRTEGT